MPRQRASRLALRFWVGTHNAVIKKEPNERDVRKEWLFSQRVFSVIGLSLMILHCQKGLKLERGHKT